MTEELTLSTEQFGLLREFFYKKTGIRFEETKRYYVEKRIASLIGDRTISFDEYFRQIRFDKCGTMVQNLINALTVNETYFFRDEKQFKCLVNHVLPEMTSKSHRRSIRIWSAPCSSGEEAYSLCLYMLEYWNLVDEYEIEIIGTDIDTNVIDHAREGIYSARSVQHLPQDVLQRYFTPRSDGSFRICKELRESIELKVVNIVDPFQTRCLRDFDIIFSRNMLIYFDDKSRRQAADTFYEALRPGGFLCLAPAESMSRICALYKLRLFDGVSFYQKPWEEQR